MQFFFIIITVSKFLLWSLHHFSNAAWGCVWIFRLFWTTSVPPQRRNSAKQQHWSPPTCFQLRYTWPSLKVQSWHIKMPLCLWGVGGDALWSWEWEENMRQSPVWHCRASQWPNFEKSKDIILWITSKEQKLYTTMLQWWENHVQKGKRLMVKHAAKHCSPLSRI